MDDDMQNAESRLSQTHRESTTQVSYDMPEDSWIRLFRDLGSGKPEALESLYEAAARKLYAFALWRTGSREDAADIVQDVFVRLAKQRDRLEGVKHPKAWLLTVTHRASVDFTRRRRRLKTQPLADFPFLTASYKNADRELEARRASSLLAELPPAQREVLYLHHYAGCTFAAIGDIMGVPTFTAASRYRLGIKKLRRLMEKKS